MMDSEEKIAELERFLIDNDDLEELESRLSGFNIFEAVGAVCQELRHSDFLAFLLDPNSNHGLSDGILKRILIDAISRNKDNSSFSALDIELANLENTEVRREWRNIDLLILLHDLKLIVAIENKVDSTESKNQLKKYSKVLQESFSSDYKIEKIFLTPEGILPENDDSWWVYSYIKVAHQIELHLRKKSGELSSKITNTLNDYLTLLRRHIVPNEKLVELCRKIYREHHTALDLIYEYKMDIYSEIRSHLKELIKDDNDIILDDCSKTYVRFRPKSWEDIDGFKAGDGWTSSKRILLYEFQNHTDNLRLKLIIGPGDTDVREKLYEMYQENSSEFRKGVNKLSDQFTQIMRLDSLNKSDYDQLDFGLIQNKIDEFWKKFKKKEFPVVDKLVLDAFK